MQTNQISFSFLVLTYNHELYIIEHLESIKYQIINYGYGKRIDILINDDYSSDRTVELVENWINLNKYLFDRVIFNFNKFNKGTCRSVIELIYLIETKYFKLTAGDDIYSYENIIDASLSEHNTAFISGFPLFIENNILKENFISNFLSIATSVIYKKKGIINQFIQFSYNNAPNMFYNFNCIKDDNVINFLQNFDVTEDWPIQLGISKYYPEYKINYIEKVFVYYRRTLGSTYIVANDRFIEDKLKIYEFLINNNPNFFGRIRLKSRLLAFKSPNKFISRIINLDLYIFIIESIFFFRTILYKMSKICLNNNKHKIHLEYIKRQSYVFKNNLKT